VGACCAPFHGGAGFPSSTMSPWPRSTATPTHHPSGILIHPTVWPQYTNGTDMTDKPVGFYGPIAPPVANAPELWSQHAARSIRISRRASCCCSSAFAGIAIGVNFKMYLLRQFCLNRVDRIFQEMSYQKNQHRFRPQPMNLIAKQEIVKLKMQCQCNTSLSIATTIAIALLNINDDKWECNSPITSAYHLTHH